jgi:hypothetical protein
MEIKRHDSYIPLQNHGSATFKKGHIIQLQQHEWKMQQEIKQNFKTTYKFTS